MQLTQLLWIFITVSIVEHLIVLIWLIILLFRFIGKNMRRRYNDLNRVEEELTEIKNLLENLEMKFPPNSKPE